MAAKITELRASFEKLSTTQKKQFITNYKEKLKGTKNKEYIDFLNECVKKYNAEVNKKDNNNSGNGRKTNIFSKLTAKQWWIVFGVLMALSFLFDGTYIGALALFFAPIALFIAIISIFIYKQKRKTTVDENEYNLQTRGLWVNSINNSTKKEVSVIRNRRIQKEQLCRFCLSLLPMLDKRKRDTIKDELFSGVRNLYIGAPNDYNDHEKMNIGDMLDSRVYNDPVNCVIVNHAIKEFIKERGCQSCLDVVTRICDPDQIR